MSANCGVKIKLASHIHATAESMIQRRDGMIESSLGVCLGMMYVRRIHCNVWKKLALRSGLAVCVGGRLLFESASSIKGMMTSQGQVRLPKIFHIRLTALVLHFQIDVASLIPFALSLSLHQSPNRLRLCFPSGAHCDVVSCFSHSPT